MPLGGWGRKLGLGAEQVVPAEGEPGAAEPGAAAKPAHARRGILRTGGGGARHHGHHGHGKAARVKWRTVLVGNDAAAQEARRRLEAEIAARERSERLKKYAKIARLPVLTYENLAIPLRLALPRITLAEPAIIALDVLTDLFELGWVIGSLVQARREGAGRAKSEAEAPAGKPQVIPYTIAHAFRDLVIIAALHMGRALALLHDAVVLFQLLQGFRILRVRELINYVEQINNDLSTNVSFLAVYKFALVLVSVPHWAACVWWALGEKWAAEPLELPHWNAQFALLTGNPELELRSPLATGWHNYLMGLYMAWAGMTALGYGTLVITVQSEIIFAIVVALVQIVFYAFVLGTLFHYLVRTDESTVYANQLLKAVDDYVTERKLPPHLGARIRSHYEFQRSKSAAATERIFAQIPLSLKTEVAVEQYACELGATPLFFGCTPQFLNQLALSLRVRYMMPREILFKRGDGSTELPWCLGGALHVKKGDVHISTVRSDLGPGQIVGEVAFVAGVPQPYTVAATPDGEVTLAVLGAAPYEELIGSYPEHAEHILTNLLKRYGLDRSGAQLAGGAVGVDLNALSEDEAKEHEALRETIRVAIVEKNEEQLAQMQLAVWQGDTETVRSLVARGFDLGVGTYDQRTTLHLAAIQGNLAVVRLLCELGADASARDRFGATPIQNAVETRHPAVADELAKAGSVLQLERPAERMLAAATKGDLAHMAMLVAHGVDINAANYDLRTALHVAAADGSTRIVEYLLANLADVNAEDRWGRAPLDEAIEHEHVLVARQIARSSPRLDEAAMGARLRAAAAAGDADKLRFLLDMGAPVDDADVDKRTALHAAVQAGSISSAYLLVAAMADVNLADRWGRPPLMDALGRHAEIASVLALHCGARLPPAAELARGAGDGARTYAECEALLRAARAESVDMYALNRKINERARTRKADHDGLLRKSHAVETSLAKLARRMAELTRHQRALFRTLAWHADIWISEYGVEDGEDADTDSDPSDAESCSSDGSDAAAAAAAAAAAPWLGRRDAPPARADGGTADRARFIKLVLQLPKAEAGLRMLRAAFGARLSPSARAHLPGAVRRFEEHGALGAVLVGELQLTVEEAEEVLREVYAELHSLLGAGAPASEPASALPELAEADEMERRSAAAAAAAAAARGSAAAAAAAHPARAVPPPMMELGVHVAEDGALRSPGGGKGSFKRVGSVRAAIPHRGSGVSLLQLSRHAHAVDEARSRRAGSQDLSAFALEGGRAQRRVSEAADSDDGELEPVFLSDLGHVVLFCSRRLLSILSARHAARGARPRSASGGALDSAQDSGRSSPASAIQRVTRGLRTSQTLKKAQPGDARHRSGSNPLADGSDEDSVAGGARGRAHPLRQTAPTVLQGGGAADDSSRKARRASMLGFARRSARGVSGASGSDDDSTSAAGRATRGHPLRQTLGGAAGGGDSIRRRALLAAAGPPMPHKQLSLPACAHGPPMPHRQHSAPGDSPPHSPSAPSSPLASARPAPAPAVCADGGGGGGGGGTARSTATPRSTPLSEALEDALSVITSLFRVFDRKQCGTVRLRDVRELQGSLGEMDSAEIRSLVSHLLEASRAFAPSAPPPDDERAAPHDERAAPFGEPPSSPARRGGFEEEGAAGAGPPAPAMPPAMDGAVAPAPPPPSTDAPAGAAGGVSSPASSSPPASPGGGARAQHGRDAWADGSAAAPPRRRGLKQMTEVQFVVGVTSWILLSSEEADDDGGGGSGEGAEGAAAGEDGSSRAGAPAAVPELRLALGGLPRGGSPGAGARAAGSAARADADADVDAGAEHVRAAAGAARHAEAVQSALNSTAAYDAIADAIVQRIGKRRLDGSAEVHAAELLALIETVVVLPPGTRAAHVRAWAAAHLGVSVDPAPDGGAGLLGGAAALGAPGGGAGGAAAAGGGASAEAAAAAAAAASMLKEVDDFLTWQGLANTLREAAAELRRRKGGRAGAGGAFADGAAELGAPGGVLAALGLRGGARDYIAGEKPWYVVSLHSALYGACHRWFLFQVGFDFAVIPLQLSFLEHTARMHWLTDINLAFDVAYVLRVLLMLHVTHVNENSREVFDPAEVRRRYLYTDFALDALASWPLDMLALALRADHAVVVGLRLLRLVYCRHAWKAYRAWDAARSDDDLRAGLLKFISGLLLTIHVCSCVWNVLGYSELAHTLTQRTWADDYLVQNKAVGGHEVHYTSPEAEMFDHYIVSFFFVVSMITTLGTAQLPTNYGEFIFYLVMMALNMTVYAWTVGGISGVVMKLDDELVGKRARLELADSYIRHIDVPAELKVRLRKFFIKRLQSASLSNVTNEEIYAGLPSGLQMEVAAHTNRALVGGAPLLRGCSDGFLNRLSSMLREREIEAETVIFRVAEACKELLFVAHGTVEAYGGAEEEGGALNDAADAYETIGPGETVGDVQFVFGIRYISSARVGKGSHALVFSLTRERYRELLKLFPSQEDALMDNAVRQYDGVATARSARSGMSGRSGARSDAPSDYAGSSAGRSARSDGLSSAVSRETDARSQVETIRSVDMRSVQNVVTVAKRKRRELYHARLCSACAKGELEKVARLLHQSQADVDYADFDGRTALHLAASGGSARVIELLLAAKASVNAQDARGATPLADALASEHGAAAKLLARHGGAHGSRSQAEALCAAAAAPDGLRTLRRLARYGGDVNAPNAEQRTALHLAAAAGREPAVRLLLEHKADANAADRAGATPLQDALGAAQDGTAALLLARGGRLGRFDAARQLCAAAAADDVAQLGRLIRVRCAVNAADPNGRTALHLATSCLHVSACHFLIAVPGVDLNAEDRFGHTPLDDAAREEAADAPVLQTLLAARGARRGSGAAHASDEQLAAAALDVESTRLQRAAAAIGARDGLLKKIRGAEAWVATEASAVGALRAVVDDALRLERERGAVLADERPGLWPALWEYARAHYGWHAHAVRVVQPALGAWAEDAAEFAAKEVAAVQKRLSELLREHDEGARVVERLYEVTFRKPSGATASDVERRLSAEAAAAAAAKAAARDEEEDDDPRDGQGEARVSGRLRRGRSSSSVSNDDGGNRRSSAMRRDRTSSAVSNDDGGNNRRSSAMKRDRTSSAAFSRASVGDSD